MTRFLRPLLLALAAAALVGLAAPRMAAQGTNQVIVPNKRNPSTLISFSFQQADIDDVLRILADATGKIVFKDSAVSTTITIRNQSRITVKEALRLITTILALKGYTLYEDDDMIIVRPSSVGGVGVSTVTTGKDLSTIPRGKAVITHIFPLENVDAVALRSEILPLIPGGQSKIIANSDTNSIVIVDEADSVRRVGQLINNLDRTLVGEINTEIIKLQFADAAEVADYLNDLFRPDETTRPAGVPQPGPMGQPMGPTRGNLAALRGRVRIAADTRANALIVSASPDNIKAIRELLKEIDVNLAPRTTYRVIELEYADATGLADTLNQVLGDPSSTNRQGGFGFPFGGFGGFGQNQGGQRRRDNAAGLVEYKVVPDVRRNSIIITAPIDGIDQLEDIVKGLDKPSMVRDVVRVFTLQNAIASEVATVLRNLFQGTTNQQGGGGFALFGQGQRTQIPPNSPLDLLRQVTIVPNDQTNQLLVSGPAQTFSVIEDLLKSGDNGLDRRLPQVFIEVVIADITLDDTNRFGIEWNALAGSSAFGQMFNLNSPTADQTGFKYSVVSRNFQATLTALKERNRVKVVSTPHVMVTDNSPALVSIGENIPYAAESSITNGVVQTTTDFLDVSIRLNVTPHISPGNHILLDIDQQVNSLIEFIQVGPNQSAPRTTNRRAGTTVIVQNDQTVVLGGIISNDEKRNVSKIPILGDIPLLGNLFRSYSKSKGRTELVVFMTPHIVRETDDAESIREFERHRLSTDPLKSLDAPFSKPLDIKPEDLKRRREESQKKLQDKINEERSSSSTPSEGSAERLRNILNREINLRDKESSPPK
jgi:general secretion pathway protein D